MSVQKAILPGIIVGVLCLVLMTSFLAAHGSKAKQASVASNSSMEADQSANGGCSLNSSYPQSVLQWCADIERYARENGLDPNLVSAVMMQESSGQPDAYSKSGAVGLLQVMPRDGTAATFMCPSGPCFSNRPSMQELFDPQYNLSYGTRMLAELIQKYGDLRDALKAYGPKDVGYYYADLVMGIMNTHR